MVAKKSFNAIEQIKPGVTKHLPAILLTTPMTMGLKNAGELDLADFYSELKKISPGKS